MIAPAIVIAAFVLTQDAPKPQADPPAKEAEQTAQQREEQDLPSLDELLGIEGAEDADGLDQSLDEQLQRSLMGEVSTEPFVLATELMADAAERLVADTPDTGPRTQRLQREAIDHLDTLIAQLEQQQQQQQNQPQSQARQSESPSGSAVSQPRPTDRTQAGAGDGTADTPPPVREGQLRGGIDPDGAGWGDLPARARDSVLEGLNDTFSSLYERLTEAYYRRLAEGDRKR